jgi:signal transduction histidine kinase
MRPFWTTLLPMLAVAALVLWGGERLARRTHEERVPADRGRLFDFAGSLRGELDRLDALYVSHLDGIALDSDWLSQEGLAKRCENLIGLRTCQIFSGTHKEQEVEGMKPPVGSLLKIPQVIAEGEEGRLVPRQAVILPKELLTGTPRGSGWLPGPDASHRVYWRREGGRLVSFAIDEEELKGCLRKHFAAWSRVPFSPLEQAGEFVAVEGPGGAEWLASARDARTGPAALVIPHRNGLGEWQVLAWDKLKLTSTRDTGTLVIACGIAGMLLMTGILLRNQQARALRLAEERVSFVNRVSHELGTPLTNILLNLDLTGRALEGRPAEARRRLDLVHEEVQRLGRLVSNVLTFSRGERKTLELRSAPCVPDEVIGGVLAQFQPSLDRRKVTVEWQRGAGESERLDPDALAQIAGNLISNVEKYASAGGWLGIETSMTADRLRLRVSDRGPGIPAQQREKIFEAFERVHRGVSEGSSGTGLGLAIARDLARRMQGELLLVHGGSGACFELDLPLPPRLVVLDQPKESA